MQFYIESLTFLEIPYKDLKEIYQKAEKYIYYGPDLSMVTLRAFAVRFVEHISTNLNLSLKKNLYQALKSQSFQNSVPEEIITKLEFLRVEGNKAAHPEEYPRLHDEKKQAAIECLKSAFQVACWLHRSFSKNGEELPSFRIPQEKKDYILYYNAIMENDIDAQYQIGMELKERNDKHKQEILQKLKNNPDKTYELFSNDYVDALQWFKKAALRNHAKASYEAALAYHLGQGTKRDQREFEKHMSKASDLGHDGAQFSFGKMLFYGTKYLEKDIEDALTLLEKSASQDNPDALNFLAQIYLNGEGVNQDYEKAYQYALHATNIGYEYHSLYLGSFYEAGIVVDKDLDKAIECYQTAAKANNTKAQIKLFEHFKNEDSKKAIHWLSRACDLQNPEALYKFGQLYYEGLFVKRNYQKAEKYLVQCLFLSQGKNENIYKLAAETIEKINAAQLDHILNKDKTINACSKIGRNSSCPCGSGKKYKKCCGRN